MAYMAVSSRVQNLDLMISGQKTVFFYVENKTGCGCFLGEKICEISVLFLGSSKGRCEIFILFSGGGVHFFFVSLKKLCLLD